ncbi:MAG: hypothetical protein ACREU7_04590 [Burkholderiales bacterium]
MALLLQDYLMAVLLPLWIAAGSGDYLAHRRSDIEHTTGVAESALHLLMLLQIGLPLLLALLFEINTLLFATFLVALVAHAITGLGPALHHAATPDFRLRAALPRGHGSVSLRRSLATDDVALGGVRRSVGRGQAGLVAAQETGAAAGDGSGRPAGGDHGAGGAAVCRGVLALLAGASPRRWPSAQRRLTVLRFHSADCQR